MNRRLFGGRPPLNLQASSAPINTAAPVISGSALIGSTVSCSTGSWANSPSFYSYQWNRNGIAISGATGSSYTVAAPDSGAALTCTVTATNAAGSTAATSAPVTAGPAYDTSIGASVDANGFASLPLRAGATRYYVKNGGSDANAGTNPAGPLATIAAAIGKIANGAGDQVLLAEGSSFAEAIPYLTAKSGFSATYPTVISSYDPADPTNEAKMGRGDQRSARPILTATPGQVSNNVSPPSYVAIKGLDFNPGNVSSASLNFVSLSDYILIENNLFRYVSFSYDTGEAQTVTPTMHHLVYRNNASYGQWNSVNERTGGIYAAGNDGVTVEDNVFHHNGWKIGALRSDTTANGGVQVGQGHPVYLQTNSGGTVRRNLMMDSADSSVGRGDIVWTENVHIREPSGIGLGNSPTYPTDRPNGINISASWNLFVTAGDMNPSALRGLGFTTTNGKPGSKVDHNLLIRNAGGQPQMFSNYANAAQPSYMLYSDNLGYLWSGVGTTYFTDTGTYAAQVHTFYARNGWGDNASGTNTNTASSTFPNAYTEAGLYSALTATFPSITDYNSLVSYTTAHPEAHVQRTLRALAFNGYGLAAPTDVTAPTLSSATASVTGANATLGVTTNEGNGVLFWSVDTSSANPHPDQVRLGLTSTGAAAAKSGSQTVSSTGAKTATATSLPAGTYYVHWMQDDAAGNSSSVVTSASFTVAAATVTWNSSSGTPASSAVWTITGSGLIATRTTNDNTLANLFDSATRATGTAIVTITARGTGSSTLFGGAYVNAPFSIGWDNATETSYIGVTNGIGYRADGIVVFGGSALASGLAVLNTNDVLKMVKTATDIKFYVNNVLQYTFSGASYTSSAVAGAAYVAATSIGSSDTALTLDSTGL